MVADDVRELPKHKKPWKEFSVVVQFDSGEH